MKKIKYFIPAMILMIIIFMFSNQSGGESSSLSGQIVVWIEHYLHISIPELIIRKGAHMAEYAVLTFTFIYGFYKSKFPINKVYLFSLVATFLYACSDEIHQLFSNGRAGQFTDVLIDTTGGLVALFMFSIIYTCILKKHNSKS